MSAIPVIRVKGSHYLCGQQIGVAYRNQITDLIALNAGSPPKGLAWEDCLKKSLPYYSQTKQNYPFIIEEIVGTAEGASANVSDLFTVFVEELWSDFNIAGHQCTDAVVCPPATSGSVLIGHNNDLSSEYANLITAVEWFFDDGTKMFTVGPGGIFVSAGVNDRGICLTGNELSPNDNKLGVPRSCVARAILNARNFEEAVKAAINSNRASSYNNVISTKNPREIVSVEGSGTDYVLIYPKNGILVHANHYISDKMKEFESVDDLTSSLSRQSRGEELTFNRSTLIGRNEMIAILKDHGRDDLPTNNTICRHSEKHGTVFSFFADLTKGVVELALGNPCNAEFKEVWKF